MEKEKEMEKENGLRRIGIGPAGRAQSCSPESADDQQSLQGDSMSG